MREQIADDRPFLKGDERGAGVGHERAVALAHDRRRFGVVVLVVDFADDLLDDVDADVYVTSDLRHHIASEYLARNRAALIDVAHAAAESVWLQPLGHRIAALGVSVTVCPFITDPWVAHHA